MRNSFSRIELFEQTGQYEPLTTRIRNILGEYKDGIGILKELIQNADDAGATSVKFLVDWRKGATESLFSPGMAECQGPALWAYNNAMFTDEDFENINKLAGETKVEDISKIGRFGLGFNAVYHLTDVPSFISRKYLVVFDPNTHHLQSLIKDRSHPGVRINLAQKQEPFRRYQDQFQLYNDVFGCNTEQTSSDFYFKGTLFRFPFRTDSQAITSDISKTVYGRERIEAIVSSLCECAQTLLIFCQHVKEVEVYELDDGSQPNKMRLMLSVQKSVQTIGRHGVNNEEPFIKQCAKWWNSYRELPFHGHEFPSGSEFVVIATTRQASTLHGLDAYSSNTLWLVVSASGTNTSLQIARSSEGKARGFLPCGGAAVVIQTDSEPGFWQSDFTLSRSGELFCFLPLSIPTGLPVHVNGYFAIMSNRVEIWKRTSMRNQAIEVKWNEALMEDALARAYIMLLQNMKGLINTVEHYKFHSLWPSIDTVDMHSWEKLVQKICSVLLDQKSKLFYSDGEWMNITDGFFLSDDFKEIYEPTVEILRSIEIHVFNLPVNILQTLQRYDRTGIVQRRTLTFTTFMETYFFRNIKTFNRTQRDSIVCFGLDRIKGNKKSCTKESSLFKQYACITASENAEILKRPCELIHPFSPAAKLFSEQDYRFPVGQNLRSNDRLYVLKTLGMVRDLDWDSIYERAQSIAITNNVEHSRKLIDYLNNRIDQLPKPDQHGSRLQEIKFLPVLRRPVDHYLLPWKGFDSPVLVEAKKIFLPEDARLVGSSSLILNTSDMSGCGKLNKRVKNLLGFSDHCPAARLVIQQLDEAIKFWGNLSNMGKRDATKKFAIESVCQKVYEFFDDKIEEDSENQSFVNELAKRKCWFLDGEFVESKKVAYTGSGDGTPFLFVLPSNYRRDYGHLFEAMEIKYQFDGEDYINALYELENTKRGHALTEHELHTAVFFISEIDAEDPFVKNYIGKIPLPDTNCILRRSKDVVINLDLWIERTGENIKVHERISPHTARALGAKSLKSVVLKKQSYRIGYGESFGQHEELTDRLKGILDGYPTEGILKELVQNADDAQASEIHFIYDTRTLASEKVATDEASEELQGPALCVYNDKPFTNKDLEGIKKLGTGSKRDSPDTTGKYGIGFNSVYHLTDCPSFLSNNDTLAFLDPHCRYFIDNDRGRLFKLKTLAKDILNNIADTLKGYLDGYLKLQGSTVFRFPLRQPKNESKISDVSPDVDELMKTFQMEARNSLLFLNHIKKITLSKIHSNNRLEEIYRVETVISSEDEKIRQNFAQKIRQQSSTPTSEIDWVGASYTLKIKENKKEVEKWLIQTCIGSGITRKKHDEVPDGRTLGLLPRGGFAARLWRSPSRKQPMFRGIVYCFLPLPEHYTNLPVHINGHFALDRNRRGLWTETDGKGKKCEWNHFMNTCVLPPAYAALIKEARNHLCNDETDKKLSRYYELFPNVSDDSSWKPLTTELYRYLGDTRARVLRLLVPKRGLESDVSSFDGTVTCNTKKPDTYEAPPHPVPLTCAKWLSVDEAYFANFVAEDFLYLFIRIGLPVLLHAPYRIHSGFKSSDVTSHEVSPKSVIDFLRQFNCITSTCNIGSLPKRLESTSVNSIQELSVLMQYCCKDEDFGKRLKGLPLLLTQDGCLRVFDSDRPVFRSKFGDLFPTQSRLFVHSTIVYRIPSIATQSEENIVREFTVQDLASLLPYVFTGDVLRDVENDETWKFPEEGTLSIRWFKRFWDFLQNYAKPEPNDNSVSLECLSEWPVIPTTCGKLVKIKDARSVLDMTTTGTESVQQENVRTFLSNLRCPELNKVITCKEEHPNDNKQIPEEQAPKYFKTAVTDPYIAHPHNVDDVLIVLMHVLLNNSLDNSNVDQAEVLRFFQFVQENYKKSKLKETLRKKIVKLLPFHKALDGQLVSLTGQYTSYVLIPSGVPTQQLDELQDRAQCLFLDSDALPTLHRLYSDLGVKAGQNVSQFYVEYVFKNFSMFAVENQMKHLQYIKDKVYPFFPQGLSVEKRTFLMTMNAIPCIPDQAGNLHFVQEFFDPHNEVFKIMFEGESDKFPPSPFNEQDWLNLLKDVGLQDDVTPELFLQFCKMVAEDGRRSPSDHRNRQRSEVLVESLFSEKNLQSGQFLTEISEIKFIAPAKVEEELTSIHTQYQCTENGHPPFLEFKDAVPWYFRDITWTTASILPVWAQPNDMSKFKNLRIACSGPTYTEVVGHLKNLVNSCFDSVDSSSLHKITMEIYNFLWEASKCSGRTPHGRCSDVCVDVGVQLKNTSCIFLEEDKTFVKAEQLVFKLHEDSPLKPFLYRVPRELGNLQHFLKRLGATEKPTPLKIASVLHSIHQQVGEEVLSSDLEKKVSCAMYMLFKLLYKRETADGIDELYLPSQEKKLVKSYKMVCNVPSRFMEVFKYLQRIILMPFEQCGLKKPTDVYIDALPDRLRPTKFDAIVREDVDPACKISSCCQAQPAGSTCEFQQIFENLLRSDEFQQGLKRLLMQDNLNPDEFEEKITKLQTDVTTKCIGLENVKVQIKYRQIDEVLGNLENSCYAIRNEETWILYMQHELKDDRGLVSTATCVNKILGNCIHKEAGLIAMLGCSSPSEISSQLNKLNITQSTSRAAHDFSDEESGSDDEQENSEDDESGGESHSSGYPGHGGGVGGGGGGGGGSGGGGSGGGGGRGGSGRGSGGGGRR